MVRYSVPKGVLVQEVLSETVLLDTEKGLFFELNSMGAEMFRKLSSGVEPHVVIQELLQDYDVTENELRRDVDELIGALEAKGLLQPVGS